MPCDADKIEILYVKNKAFQNLIYLDYLNLAIKADTMALSQTKNPISLMRNGVLIYSSWQPLFRLADGVSEY